ncbi:TIGR01777 family oxidoreductase [Paenibacillus sp. CC-CFT747]|nr:TIGR01777 family oxidoreductase [Paenibacillus sp. CC-CFT747]
MKIAVSGGTGFIGGRLIRHLKNRNHEVILISRHPGEEKDGIKTVTWDQMQQSPSLLEGVDAIVNLAGESINQRWNEEAKKRILDSRLTATRRIAELVDRLKHKPAVVVNGSGMSIYGTSETGDFDESSPKHLTDFLAEVVEQWEEAADEIRGTRVVKLRISMVLDNKEGALPPMMLPYKMGGGGRIASGRQWFSWIHIEDMVRAIVFCLENESISGPVNASAPYPVRNDDFGRALGKALHRPHWFPVPEFLLRALFGEMSVLMVQGQRVRPKALLDHGFFFQYDTIEKALTDLLKKD